MFWFENIYAFINSIFEMLTFRSTNESYITNDSNNEHNILDDYEFIMLRDDRVVTKRYKFQLEKK